MVMKSERGGRLARNSAELLAGDKPGEFTVVTEEGSSIPVAVKDVSGAMAAPDSTNTDAPVTPTRNWWGSMTAALGLKAGADSEAPGPAPREEGLPEAEAAQAPPRAEQSEAPAAAAEQEPLPVSAFANDVAVKPVSAETTDSSAVQGALISAFDNDYIAEHGPTQVTFRLPGWCSVSHGSLVMAQVQRLRPEMCWCRHQ